MLAKEPPPRAHLAGSPLRRAASFICSYESSAPACGALRAWREGQVQRAMLCSRAAAAAAAVDGPPACQASPPCRLHSPDLPAPQAAARWWPRRPLQGRQRPGAGWAPWIAPWTTCWLVTREQEQQMHQ